MKPSKRKQALTCILATSILAGCAQAPVAGPVAAEPARETMLLVSLDDGTIVRQTVDLGADVCIKSVTEPTTTCLRQGEPVLSETGEVVGYEMLTDVIDLYDAE